MREQPADADVEEEHGEVPDAGPPRRRAGRGVAAQLDAVPQRGHPGQRLEDERQLGATVIDMGGGTTGIGVWSEGNLLHTAQLAVGGSHVTNDLARVLSTSVADAERLKTVKSVREMDAGNGFTTQQEDGSIEIPEPQVVELGRPDNVVESGEW